MTRILVAGVGPLPFEPARMNWGPGIRTWQFCTSLAQAGHVVTLVALADPRHYGESGIVAQESREGVEIRRVDAAGFFNPGSLQRHFVDSAAEAVVGATLLASSILARSDLGLPFWADQFGSAMAEAQARAALEHDNTWVAETWRLVRPVLSMADRISVVSRRQRLAVIGELGAVGRLTAQTCGYEFIDVVPCAVPCLSSRTGEEDETGPIREGEFLVLWAGSYNVWSDVETLVDGLELAMRSHPDVRFVSIGGGVEGYHQSSYSKLQQRVAASEFSDRFQLEGWVEQADVSRFVARADLGIVSELPIYEGELGSKNRVLEWVMAGLPVLTNALGDLGEYLQVGSRGLVFEPGDAQGMARQVLWAASNREQLSEMAKSVRISAREDFALENTTSGLRRWAASPTRAPDWDTVACRRVPSDHWNWRRRWIARGQDLPWLRRSSILRALRRGATSGRHRSS